MSQPKHDLKKLIADGKATITLESGDQYRIEYQCVDETYGTELPPRVEIVHLVQLKAQHADLKVSQAGLAVTLTDVEEKIKECEKSV